MLAIESEDKLLEARMKTTYEFLYNKGVEEDEIFEILLRIFELGIPCLVCCCGKSKHENDVCPLAEVIIR